jgi:hypothetical protein
MKTLRQRANEEWAIDIPLGPEGKRSQWTVGWGQAPGTELAARREKRLAAWRAEFYAHAPAPSKISRQVRRRLERPWEAL